MSLGSVTENFQSLFPASHEPLLLCSISSPILPLRRTFAIGFRTHQRKQGEFHLKIIYLFTKTLFYKSRHIYSFQGLGNGHNVFWVWPSFSPLLNNLSHQGYGYREILSTSLHLAPKFPMSVLIWERTWKISWLLRKILIKKCDWLLLIFELQNKEKWSAKETWQNHPAILCHMICRISPGMAKFIN